MRRIRSLLPRVHRAVPDDKDLHATRGVTKEESIKLMWKKESREGEKETAAG